MAGGVVGILVGIMADKFAGNFKFMILMLYGGSTACFLWFALLCAKVLPYAAWQLYASYILAGMLLNGAIPLFFELTVETTYPAAEACSAGCIMLVDNFIQVLFLFVPMDKVGTSWMNWTVTAVIPFAILILAPMTTTHARYDLDTMHTNAGSSTADPDAWDGDSLPRDESEDDKNKPLLSYTA